MKETSTIMKQPLQLDALDRKLLRLMQSEGDLTNAALAERVGASSASCWRRLKALESSGALGRPIRLLDPSLIGLGLDVLCNVRMRSHEVTTRTDFENMVQKHEEVLECYSMTGEWDYILRVAAVDVRDYERFLMQELLSHPAVATASSHFALKRIKFTTAMPV